MVKSALFLNYVHAWYRLQVFSLVNKPQQIFQYTVRAVVGWMVSCFHLRVRVCFLGSSLSLTMFVSVRNFIFHTSFCLFWRYLKTFWKNVILVRNILNIPCYWNEWEHISEIYIATFKLFIVQRIGNYGTLFPKISFWATYARQFGRRSTLLQPTDRTRGHNRRPHRTYSSKVLSHNPRGNTNSEYVQYGDTETAGGWTGLVVRPVRVAK